MKKESGITLIALVITIIVLLILAGVSISMVTGDNGIASKATEAKEKTNAANDEEEQKLQDALDYIDSNVSGGSGTILASQIDASNYGDYVNYSKDLGLTLNLEGETEAPKTDWRIFYKEGERVYLIAADYVPNTSTLLKNTEAGMEKNGDYALYWYSAPSALATGTRQDSLFGITNNSYTLNASNANSKCVSELLETSNWSNFVDTTVADYAIGGPTIEMYTNSWNAKGYTTLTPSTSKTDGTNSGYGYYINDNIAVFMSSGTNVYGNNLYTPHGNVVGTEGIQGYWLAAPTANDTKGVMSALVQGGVSSYFYDYGCDYSGVGVRPVVALLPNVTATKDANGVWQLD